MPTQPVTTAPRILVLHRVQGMWSALAASPKAKGLVLDSCTRLPDSALAAWVTQHNAVALRVVLPGGSAVCRTISLGEDANEALLHQRLMTEVSGGSGAMAPMHRTANCVLEAVEGVGVRTGITLTWPESDATTLPDLPCTTLVVPDIVGLLAINGPNETTAWIDADHDSIALTMQGPSRLVARCLKETQAAASLDAIVAESADLADASDAALPPGDCLRLSDAARQRLADACVTDLPADLDQFAIAIGCALACVSSLAPLTVLQQSPPAIVRSRIERVLTSMRTPRTAGTMVAAALAFAFVGPVIVNGARLVILRWSHPNLESVVAAANITEHRNQQYRVLAKESWPMTKLLADIGAAAPLGIVLEQIRIDHGEPIRIKGHATPRGGASAADLITRMKAHLQASKIFDDVTVEWDGKKRIGQREFTIITGVRDAQRRPRYEDTNDFAAWTHQQRIYDLPQTADGGPPARASEIGDWTPIAPGTPAVPPANATAEAPQTTPEVTPAVSTTTTTSSSRTPSRAGGRYDAHRPGARPGRNDNESTTVDPTTIVRTPLTGGGARPDIDQPNGRASDSDSVSVGSSESRSGDLDSGALGAMPQILTDEQLAVLTADDLRSKLSEVTQARERTRDPEQQAILRDYFQRIFKRLRDLKKAEKNP
jgi:hypothetical protein